MIIYKSFDIIMNNKHELFNKNMIIISRFIYTINEHDSDFSNLQWNFYTRFMIYHHDSRFRNIINIFSIWFILISYDFDSKNQSFDATMNDKHELFNEYIIITSEFIYIIYKHDSSFSSEKFILII